MISFEISLKEFRIGDVLQFICRVKKTGVLRIKGMANGEIYLKDGLVIHAANGAEKGVEALISLSFMDIERALFEANVLAPEQTISQDLGKLTEDLEKRRVEFEQIKQQMPPMDIALAKSTKELDSAVALRRTDWQVLALVDGKRTLADVIAHSKLGSYEAIKTVLWLKEKGLIYDPKEAERVMLGFKKYLIALVEFFDKNGLEWLNLWAEMDAANKNIMKAIKIDNETSKMTIVAQLTADEIKEFFSRFDLFLNQQVPKVFGKMLAKKKLEEFQRKINIG